MLGFSSMTECFFMGVLPFWLYSAKEQKLQVTTWLPPSSVQVPLAKPLHWGRSWKIHRWCACLSLSNIVSQLWKHFIEKIIQYFNETYSWKLYFLIGLIYNRHLLSTYFVLGMMLIIVCTTYLLILATTT